MRAEKLRVHAASWARSSPYAKYQTVACSPSFSPAGAGPRCASACLLHLGKAGGPGEKQTHRLLSVYALIPCSHDQQPSKHGEGRQHVGATEEATYAQVGWG